MGCLMSKPLPVLSVHYIKMLEAYRRKFPCAALDALRDVDASKLHRSGVIHFSEVLRMRACCKPIVIAAAFGEL